MAELTKEQAYQFTAALWEEIEDLRMSYETFEDCLEAPLWGAMEESDHPELLPTAVFAGEVIWDMIELYERDENARAE